MFPYFVVLFYDTVYHMVKAKNKSSLWLRMSLLLTQKWLPSFLFWPHDPMRLLFVRMVIFHNLASLAFWEATGKETSNFSVKSLHVSGSLRNTKRPWYLQRRLQAAHSVPSLRGSSHALFANHVRPNVSSTLHVLVGFALFSASQVGAAELDKNTVTESCPSLCDPMGCSTPGFPALHSPRVGSNSCPLSQWCHPTISYSVAPFSFCPQSFPASGTRQITDYHN